MNDSNSTSATVCGLPANRWQLVLELTGLRGAAALEVVLLAGAWHRPECARRLRSWMFQSALRCALAEILAGAVETYGVFAPDAVVRLLERHRRAHPNAVRVLLQTIGRLGEVLDEPEVDLAFDLVHEAVAA